MELLKRYRTVVRVLLFLVGAMGLSSQHVHAETCELRLGQAELDFGQFRHPGGTLDSRDVHPVGTRYVSLQASCPAPTRLAVMVRGDSQTEHFQFARSGQLKVRLSSALLDGRAIDLAPIRAASEVPGTPASTIEVVPGDLVVPVSAGLVTEGQVLSMQIEVSPEVAISEFSTRDQKVLESHLNFEVRAY
ncbi:DUF1120 domain-containing protein [Pseudomonas sp. MDT1-17]